MKAEKQKTASSPTGGRSGILLGPLSWTLCPHNQHRSLPEQTDCTQTTLVLQKNHNTKQKNTPLCYWANSPRSCDLRQYVADQWGCLQCKWCGRPSAGANLCVHRKNMVTGETQEQPTVLTHMHVQHMRPFSKTMICPHCSLRASVSLFGMQLLYQLQAPNHHRIPSSSYCKF